MAARHQRASLGSKSSFISSTKPKLPTEDRKIERVMVSLPNHWIPRTLEPVLLDSITMFACQHDLEPAFF